MEMKQIQIDIDDNRAYTQLVFLVDIPDFLKDVEAIRSKYKITPPFDFTRATDLESHFAKLSDRSFDSDIAEIRRKYHYPEMFDSAIRDSVLYHRISSFKTAYAMSFERPTFPILPDGINTPKDQYMTIVVTPYSTENDIKQAFKDCCTDIRKSIEWDSPVYRVIETDTISNIKRDRDWYWRTLQGQRPHDIAVADNKGAAYYLEAKKKMKFARDLPEKQSTEYNRYFKFIQDYTETVRKAIKRYKQKLHRHLDSS